MKARLVVPETTLSSSFFLPCRHWYSPAAGTWAGKLSTCGTTASVRVPVFFLGYACLWMQLGRFLLRSVVLGFVPFQLGFTNHPQAPCFFFFFIRKNLERWSLLLVILAVGAGGRGVLRQEGQEGSRV